MNMRKGSGGDYLCKYNNRLISPRTQVLRYMTQRAFDVAQLSDESPVHFPDIIRCSFTSYDIMDMQRFNKLANENHNN